jgi:hypothetical protein
VVTGKSSFFSTGGVLFGTTSFLYPPGGGSEPGFLSFGNNYYTSASATQHTVSLTAPLASYIQFGKLTRPLFAVGSSQFNSPD